MRLIYRLLRALEVGLVLGLTLLALLVSRSLLQINRHSAVVHYTPPPAQPTLTATAVIRPEALPTGSHVHVNIVWPAAASAPAPPAVWAVPVLTAAPVSPHALRVVIPVIGVDAPVVHGTEAESLKLGIGHYAGTADPGQSGNHVLTGHNDIYGEVFRDLPMLKPGDEVTVYTASARYRYVIRGWRIVEPTEVSVLDSTPGPTLTLISCYPYLIDTQRIVVVGDLAAD